MVEKTYICKGCGETETAELHNITFPQCTKCCGIMAEHIEYGVPIAKLIPGLEALWHKHYPDIPVHVQLIYNNRRFKFRWFNGPDVEEVKQNSPFMAGYHEIADAAGIPKHRQSHNRVFKQYVGPTVPYRTFVELTCEEKENVVKSIEDNIISVYKETFATGSTLKIDEDGSLCIRDCSEIRDESCGSEFIQYECTCCKIVMDEDAEVISHIIANHLN